MTIGIVLPSVPGYSETFFISKIKGLQCNNYRVLLFVNNNQNEIRYLEGVTIYSAPELKKIVLLRYIQCTLILSKNFMRSPFRCAILFKEHLRNGDSFAQCLRSLILNGHLVSHNLDWLHFGFATVGLGKEFVAMAMGCRSAVSLRGYDIDVFPLKNLNIYKRLFDSVDKVHSISYYLLKKAYALGLHPNHESEVIPPGINTKLFNFKNGYKNSTKALKIVTVGRIHWVKGGDFLMSILAALDARGIHFEFTWIGDGPDIERLVYAAHQFGISDSVNFSGRMNQEDVVETLMNHDIYVQASLSEGFCNAVIEAQSMGLLTVANDCGALSENIKHGVTGWLSCIYDTDAMAELIIKIVNMPEALKNIIRNNASNRVKALFDIEDNINKMIKFYES